MAQGKIASRLKKVLPDLLVIFIFLFLMASIITVFYVLLAWINFLGYIPALDTSADAINYAKVAPDADNDLLPDIIENAKPGTTVYIPDTEIILGWGTGTDPNNADTDGDLFTDALENKMGTDPHNWFNPGVMWIIWIIVIGVVIYWKYIRKPDRLKEYIRAEEEIAMETGGKYAVGGTSIFGKKKISELSEEERAQLVASDARFHQLTAFNDVRPNQRIRKRKWGRIIGNLFIALVLTYVIISVIFSSG